MGKTLTAFDGALENDELLPQEYPGKKLLDEAGIDIEGKTFEELFELEKKLYKGVSLEDDDSAKSTPTRELQDSSVEDDIALILTDDFMVCFLFKIFLLQYY